MQMQALSGNMQGMDPVQMARMMREKRGGGPGGLAERFGSKDAFLEEASAKVMEHKDADGDGMLAASELKLDDEQFAKFDGDGDGLLSQDELKSGLDSHMQEKMQEMRQRMQDGGLSGLAQGLGQGRGMRMRANAAYDQVAQMVHEAFMGAGEEQEAQSASLSAVA